MEDTLTISAQKVRETYKNACKEGKKILEGIFGEDALKPKNIMDRVKTFEDAYNILGEGHPYVIAYDKFCDNPESDITAYLRLRIITAALNEGWIPKFVKGEYRYYPYFYLYTKEEYDKFDKEEKKKCCLLGGEANHGSYDGVASVHSAYGVSISTAYVGSRLCFKSSELATYAGIQFKELWRDFYFAM